MVTFICGSKGVHYRVWIKDFAVWANPLYQLTRGKNQNFDWGNEQQAAMDDLKAALTHAPVLQPIDYQPGGKIILSVGGDSTTRRGIGQ